MAFAAQKIYDHGNFLKPSKKFLIERFKMLTFGKSDLGISTYKILEKLSRVLKEDSDHIPFGSLKRDL